MKITAAVESVDVDVLWTCAAACGSQTLLKSDDSDIKENVQVCVSRRPRVVIPPVFNKYQSFID